jgi:uncharacterized protein YuzE
MKEAIIVHTEKPPTVEIDSSVPAAYIRFSRAKIVSTQPVDADDMIVNVDLDEHAQVVGVEIVGVDEFNITKLSEKAHIIGIPDELLPQTRYVPTVAGVAVCK